MSADVPLVVTVIPFDQIGIDFGHSPEAGQFARPPGTLQRTGEDVCERHPLKPLAQATGIPFAMLGERNVGQAGVLARQAPLRFAMPGKEDGG